VLWAGRPGRLWRSVVRELTEAQELTRHNRVLTLQFCVNYGGRAELADAAAAIAREVADGRLAVDKVDERTVSRHLYQPTLPDVDLFIRTSGEQRISNFLLWQAAYAELVFVDRLWPDVDRRDLWAAVESYVQRERRYGGAIDRVTDSMAAVTDSAGHDAARHGSAGSSSEQQGEAPHGVDDHHGHHGQLTDDNPAGR